MRALALIALALAAAPPSSPAQSSSSCAADLRRLIDKVDADYAGMKLEYRPAQRRAALRGLQHRLGRRAAAVDAMPTPGDACFPVLDDYVGAFRDPHLFIFQSSHLDTAESARRAATVARAPLDETTARAYLREHESRLDPIEGIWFDRGFRVAIVHLPAAPRGEFSAVVLTSDTSLWRPGAIRARFTRRADGAYDAVLDDRNFARRYLRVHVHKRLLLRLDPGLWGKECPIGPLDSGLVDRSDAHRATLVTRGRAVVLSIPSHDPAYRNALDSIVARDGARLAGAEPLIIDLRGNEGGSSWVTDTLLRFVMSDSLRPDRSPFSRAMMLSSPDQIDYAIASAGGAAGTDTTPRLRHLLARLRASPGALVPFSDSVDAADDAPRGLALVGARRVGVLIDRGTVSAAEAFLDVVMRSTRVTTFGEPTAGALDYQSVNIVPFRAAGGRWYLGYPTITASATLPAGGIRGRGIAPMVRIDLARERDPIGLVVAELSRK